MQWEPSCCPWFHVPLTISELSTDQSKHEQETALHASFCDPSLHPILILDSLLTGHLGMRWIFERLVEHICPYSTHRILVNHMEPTYLRHLRQPLHLH
jgi:hypothetical protein